MSPTPTAVPFLARFRLPPPQRVFHPLLQPEHPGWSPRAPAGDGAGDTLGSPGCGAVGGTGIGARGNPGSRGEGCGLSQGASWVPPSPSQAVPPRDATGWVTPPLVHHGTLTSRHSVLLLHQPLVAPGEDPGPAGDGGGCQPCQSAGMSAGTQNSGEQRQLPGEPWECAPPDPWVPAAPLLPTQLSQGGR